MAKKKTDDEKKKISEAKEKKREEAPPTRSQAAAMLLETINKKMKGHAELRMSNEHPLPYLTKRFPTGLLSLDLALRGGFPAGGLSQVYGPKNSGKSWLTWQMIRQLQFILGEKLMVLLAMTEMRADRSQARAAGVVIGYSDEDIAMYEKARIENGGLPFSAEEKKEMKRTVGTFHELHAVSGEALYNVVLNAVENNIYHLIIIDSIGNIMSEAQSELESLSDKTRGGAAAVNAQFLRKLTALLGICDDYGRTRDTCLIGINQVQDNMENPQGGLKAPGGRVLEHTKLVDLYVSGGKALGEELPVFTPEGTKQRFVKWGKEVNWKVEKGKAGIRDGVTGTWNYRYDTNSADFYMDTIVAGVRNGIIEAGGGGNFKIYDQEDPTKVIFSVRGRDTFVEMLQKDDREKAAAGDPNTISTLIRTLCYRKEGINISYDWDEEY